MSEYDEIAAAVATAYGQQERYEQEGQEFASRLVAAIEKHLEVPRGKLRVLPTDAGAEETYVLPDAVKVGDDASFRFQVRIDLPTPWWIAFPVRFKKTSDGWDVALGCNATTQYVNPKMEGHFACVVEELAQTVKKTFRTSFDNFMKGGGRLEKRIGFGRRPE